MHRWTNEQRTTCDVYFNGFIARFLLKACWRLEVEGQVGLA
jgi:hypothetical protein